MEQQSEVFKRFRHDIQYGCPGEHLKNNGEIRFQTHLPCQALGNDTIADCKTTRNIAMNSRRTQTATTQLTIFFLLFSFVKGER